MQRKNKIVKGTENAPLLLQTRDCALSQLKASYYERVENWLI